MNVIQREYAFHTVIISLSQVSVSITFLRILMRIHIPVKEVQLKSTKREKSQISSLTPHLFLTGEINMNKNKFLMEIFFPSRNTRMSYKAQLNIFQRYPQGNSMSFATQNSLILHIFGCILISEAVEGTFQNIKSEHFSF